MSWMCTTLLVLLAVFLALSCESEHGESFESMQKPRFCVNSNSVPSCFCPLTQCLLRSTRLLCPAAQTEAWTVRGSYNPGSLSPLCHELTLLPLPQVRWRRSSWRRLTPWTSSGGAADGASNLRTSLMVSPWFGWDSQFGWIHSD